MGENKIIIAVVPTFRPDETLVSRLDALAGQVTAIVVVDDGSPPDAEPVLAMIVAAGYEVIRSNTNAGIAAALNTGVRLALTRGADFVLTVDQDSALPPDYVASALGAFLVAAPETRVGVVCTDRVNGQPSIPERTTPEGLGVVRIAIQSGFLISRACLQECGLFDDRLFIDTVDTEYCLRIAERGYITVVGPGTDISHSLGEQALLRPFGRQRYVDGEPAHYEYHKPFRRYYIVRNNIDLYLRYLSSKPRWVLSSLRHDWGPTTTSIVAGPHRGRQLLAVIAGIAHGLARRRGRISPRLQKLLAV